MDFHNIFFIISLGLGVLLFMALCAIFLISRRSQRVMKSLLDIMISPERAQAQDAARVLTSIMSDEMAKIASYFQTMHGALRTQIGTAEEMIKTLTERNANITNVANDAGLHK